MSDADVARTVEEAGLNEMSRMDIDDVYTLMDVQLRERPDPMTLYRRWEKQNWSVFDLDFSKDASDWAMFPYEFKEQLVLGFRGFYLGEAAVTDTLSPMVHAAPTDADRQFLATQLVDEARHTIFFDRFFKEVLQEEGLEESRRVTDEIGYTSNKEKGFARLFYRDLVDVTDAVRLDPRDYGKWVDSIVLYHMLIEGMLALAGQRRILQVARQFDVLPGFRAGFTAVTRDESRHVNYGVYALSVAVAEGLTDRIVSTASRYLDATCDVVTRPFRRIPPVPEAMLQGFKIRDGWTFSVGQLRKRLRGAGIGDEPIAGLERQWLDRIEANLDEYESRFGEPHPARLQERNAVA
ncbi:MAG TPA: ribonucleotide-diphosphate reductase subunit beta [Actinomycetota bacterium]|nr:ribonucleotide-diphosphate reductase subunit beta [Actinomycetota bacterium]